MLSDLGYLALKKQTGALVPVTPDTFVPLYEENLTTQLNPDEDKVIFGQKWARLQSLPGQRDHSGSFTCMAEPNTTAQLLDMLVNRLGVTGSNPYTWAMGLASSDPNSYTIDI